MWFIQNCIQGSSDTFQFILVSRQEVASRLNIGDTVIKQLHVGISINRGLSFNNQIALLFRKAAKYIRRALHGSK